MKKKELQIVMELLRNETGLNGVEVSTIERKIKERIKIRGWSDRYKG